MRSIKARLKKMLLIIITALALIFILSIFTPIRYLGIKPEGEYRVKVSIGETELSATMENNTSSWAFHRLLTRGPKKVRMRDYGEMEKVGMLWRGLPTNNRQITAEPGDIILFMGSSIVVYYNRNSWNFTKMGHIDGITAKELKNLLGSGNVTLTFSLEK